MPRPAVGQARHPMRHVMHGWVGSAEFRQVPRATALAEPFDARHDDGASQHHGQPEGAGTARRAVRSGRAAIQRPHGISHHQGQQAPGQHTPTAAEHLRQPDVVASCKVLAARQPAGNDEVCAAGFAGQQAHQCQQRGGPVSAQAGRSCSHRVTVRQPLALCGSLR